MQSSIVKDFHTQARLKKGEGARLQDKSNIKTDNYNYYTTLETK